MFAEKHLASLLPMCLPHWRLNRVTEMLRQRPLLRSRWVDDHPIRVYRRMLLQCVAAGDDEEKLEAARREYPPLYEAHRYHYSPDFRRRQEIECDADARLAGRHRFQFGADAKAIEYYASLFFDVRDALDYKTGFR